MQYHLNGFRSGDPSILTNPKVENGDDSQVDVLIVGCGPAGLTLATQLSAFPEISLRIIERKPGPLEFGQADGIACRSVEMFEAFGFAEKVIREGYWVNEVTFWRPGQDADKLMRVDRIEDVEDDLSQMPHVILSQARVHDFYLEVMRNSPNGLVPEYNKELVSVQRRDESDYPIEAVFSEPDQETTEVIKAKYIVGCDGARSVVRKSMGHELKGESARQLWGVMDVLPKTNFPDIRLKCAIQSVDQGSILIIPREGGYLVRLYIELDELKDGERAADRGVTAEQLIDKARKILFPYDFDVMEVAWWSAYEIGQRVCDVFDDVSDEERGDKMPRMFIAGDACHTHSPKAGQGMNVSMADTFNLGWKLASVLRDQASPRLLDTYSQERYAKAKELIDFDRDMARLFSEKPKTAADAQRFQSYFQKHGRYTAGVETHYEQSLIVGAGTHQDLASGYVIGKRFHSAPVIRLCDAKPMELGHVLKADGRWRLIAFAPAEDDGSEGKAVAKFCSALNASQGILSRVVPKNEDIDSVIDVRAVFQMPHRDMAVENLPSLLLPQKGRYSLVDYEKAFCPSQKAADIFDLRGIDRIKGCAILVRPDQFVADIFTLEDVNGIENFLKPILI